MNVIGMTKELNRSLKEKFVMKNSTKYIATSGAFAAAGICLSAACVTAPELSSRIAFCEYPIMLLFLISGRAFIESIYYKERESR